MRLNTMLYRGYSAAIEYRSDDRCFYGDVLDLDDAITFTGSSVAELEASFAVAVDAYIDWCTERGKEPAKPYSGRVLLRLEPALHREAALAAATRRMSLNAFFVDAIERATRGDGIEPCKDETSLREAWPSPSGGR